MKKLLILFLLFWSITVNAEDTCENNLWDKNIKKYRSDNKFTEKTKYWDDWGNCFDEEYYNVLTGEIFDVGEFIAECEIGYGGKAYALGSIEKMLYVGSLSELKPTSECSKCVAECFRQEEIAFNKWFGRERSDEELIKYIEEKCGKCN